MPNPRPGDWTPSQHRLTAVPVSGPDPSGQPPYYLNGYEHEDPPVGVVVEPEPLPPGWATPGWSAPGWSDSDRSAPGPAAAGWSASGPAAAPVPPMPAPPSMPARPVAPALPVPPVPAKPGTGDPWDQVQGSYSFATAERPRQDPAATGTRTLWMIALAFAAILTLILTLR
jgi:hypothetical protein